MLGPTDPLLLPRFPEGETESQGNALTAYIACEEQS